VIIKDKLDYPVFFFFSFFFHGRIKVKKPTINQKHIILFYFLFIYLFFLTKQMHSPTKLGGDNFLYMANELVNRFAFKYVNELSEDQDLRMNCIYNFLLLLVLLNAYLKKGVSFVKDI